MSKIIDKRNSLERFIREQVLGPGVNGYRFVDLENESITYRNLLNEDSIKYDYEIINSMPASVYSSGILFPKDNSQSAETGIVLENNETYYDFESNEKDSQNSSGDDIDTDNTININQMFPSSMGMTFCLNESFLEKGTLQFEISARIYQKLKRDKEGVFNEKIGLLCELDKELITDYLNEYELKDFLLISKGENNFLTLKRITQEKITEIRKLLIEKSKNKVEYIFNNQIKDLLKNKTFQTPKSISGLIQTIYYELRDNVVDNDTRKKLYSESQNIEQFENLLGHLIDLLDINSGRELWQSKIIKKTVIIENIKFSVDKKKQLYLSDKPNPNNGKVRVINSDETEQEGLKEIYLLDIDKEKKEFAALSANVQLSRNSRQLDEKKIFVKIQLINDSSPFEKDPEGKRYYSVATEKVNNKSFFGVNISIVSEDLVPYSNHEYLPSKENEYSEDTTTSFIYDQFKDYAIGHGCSVKWNNQVDPLIVETEYLPYCETPDIDSIPRNKSKNAVLDDEFGLISPLFLENSKSQEFKWLSIFSDATDTEIINGLNDFVDSYGSWIELKRKDLKYQDKFLGIANQELKKCEDDYKRMKKNIANFLSGVKNKDMLGSFRLMNAAMFMQLWHSVKAKDGKVIPFMNQDEFTCFNSEFYTQVDDKLFPPYTQSAGWRAFQLAFILLNLDGIFKPDDDEKWEKRNNWVDLVWFPTGGGKTEAYLGLIALTIINRRKEFKEKGGGTAAIMRYTLRLLTMQQFQRASLVIMALELMRRWGNYELGDEPINIGMWVGDNSLPNKIDDLIIEYENLKNGRSNKIPFSSCPWCNSKLNPIPTGTRVTDENDTYNFNRVHLYCDNVKCNFSEPDFFEDDNFKGAIPVNLCDETIYQHPPALLFGTVDKFAQLAHKVDGTKDGRKKDSRRIFGSGNWEKGKPKDNYLPPDLIIQDELHLLLGPLGSAVALFESAVDQLCTRKDGTRPKIISSTATTRNTQLQIAALFDRKVNLFPKPGVECDDSFFAFYKRRFKSIEDKTPEYLSKRKYVGVLPTGRTQIWMQMRLAAIIMTHRAIFELKELGEKHPIEFDAYDKAFKDAMDYYHTTISYFNSLKEVGKTQSQVQTYILKELRRVFSRVVRPQKLMHSIYTYGPIQESELTGRLSGEEVKNALKSVETKWNAKNRFANVQDNESVRGKVPPEFVVATNMISVGIDVSRFNTIIMNSMPRNTAEYIQASSRVARNDYGLVLTVHHPFRARDISHYEKFIEFHEKMYSYVEPISITPFTQKAVERYMGLYLAAMIRHTTRFTERVSASDISSITETELSDIVSYLTSYFEGRKIRMSSYDNLISNLLKQENIVQIKSWIEEAFSEWKEESDKNLANNKTFVFNNKSARSTPPQEQLYVDIEEYEGNIHSKKWQVPMSLRVIEPEAAIKINSL